MAIFTINSGVCYFHFIAIDKQRWFYVSFYLLLLLIIHIYIVVFRYFL